MKSYTPSWIDDDPCLVGAIIFEVYIMSKPTLSTSSNEVNILQTGFKF